MAAWLPQAREIAREVTVETLVALGRAPHRKPGASLSATDRAAVANALGRTDMAQFADGPPAELLTPERLRAVYGIEAHIAEAEGGLIVQPLTRVGP